MIFAYGISFYGSVFELIELINHSGIWQIKWRKSSYDLMQERSVQFIMFY